MQLVYYFLVCVSIFAGVNCVLLSSQKTYVCDNKKRTITCEQKKNSTIKVLDAYYGRHLSYKCLESENDYGKFKNSTCKSSYTKTFQKRCNGAKKCELDTKSLKAQCKSFVPKMLSIVFECESLHKETIDEKPDGRRKLKTLKRHKHKSHSKRKLTHKQLLRLRERKAKLRRLRHERKQLLKNRRTLSGKKIEKKQFLKVPNLSLNHKLLMDPKLIKRHLRIHRKS